MNIKRKYEVSSHENFSHDHIGSVGYDWDYAANPKIEPKRPLRIYLPETTEEIVKAVLEVKALQPEKERKESKPRFHIRSKGHSSNNLVLTDRGTVLWTEYLNKMGDMEGHSVWVQAGAVLADVDAKLEEKGYGFPIIGDHNHITAGGFASVGGVSPASNVDGMFIDNVEEIEWVDWEGNVGHCSMAKDRSDFLRLLGGTGQHGIIARLRCRVKKVRKTRTILKNDRKVVWNLDEFIRLSAEKIKNPGNAVMERGLWLDVPLVGTRALRVGQYSSYLETPPSRLKWAYDRVVHGFLHGLGYVAGRLWGVLDKAVQLLGLLGVIWSPRYASIKNIESFADKILDSSVGDPHRMLIVFAPVERYAEMFRALHDLCCEFHSLGCLSFITIYVKGIKSPYLSQALGNKDAHSCELLLYLGIKPNRMKDRDLDEMVERIDNLCIEMGALRYMHTRTVGRDDERRQKIDPNLRVNAAERAPLAEARRAG